MENLIEKRNDEGGGGESRRGKLGLDEEGDEAVTMAASTWQPMED